MVTPGLQDKVVTMTIALTPRQREQLSRIAQDEKRSVSWFIREAVDAWLARRDADAE